MLDLSLRTAGSSSNKPGNAKADYKQRLLRLWAHAQVKECYGIYLLISHSGVAVQFDFLFWLSSGWAERPFDFSGVAWRPHK